MRVDNWIGVFMEMQCNGSKLLLTYIPIFPHFESAVKTFKLYRLENMVHIFALCLLQVQIKEEPLLKNYEKYSTVDPSWSYTGIKISSMLPHF